MNLAALARVPRIESMESSGSAPALQSNALRSADGVKDRPIATMLVPARLGVGLASRYDHTTHIVRSLRSFLARN